MKKLVDEEKTFDIIGDINIDINKTNKYCAQADRYTHVITSNGAFPLVKGHFYFDLKKLILTSF